jgi:hypothetical protein
MAELFWDAQPATLARWPNRLPDGSWHWSRTAAGFPPNCGHTGTSPGSSTPPCTGFTSSLPFANSSAQLSAWAQEAADRDPALVGYWAFDWDEIYLPLTGVNVTAKAMITTDALQPDRRFPFSGTYYR